LTNIQSSTFSRRSLRAATSLWI